MTAARHVARAPGRAAAAAAPAAVEGSAGPPGAPGGGGCREGRPGGRAIRGGGKRRLGRPLLGPLLWAGLALAGADCARAQDSGGVPWSFGAQPFGMLSMPELVKPPPAEKRLFLKLTAGFQYDSNVILNAPGTPVPPELGRKEDWRYLLNLSGSYLPLKGADGEVVLNYAFFQSQHAELSDFNLTQNLAEVAVRYRLSPGLTLRYSNVFQHLLLGSDLFDWTVMTGPSLTMSEGPGQSSTLDLRYRASEYRNVPFFRSNADRTGSNYSAGLTQNISPAPSLLVRAGYVADRDHARSDLWDGTGHRGSLQGSLILPRETLFDLYGEYYRKEYDGIYHSIGGRRTDRSWSAVVTLTTYFQERYGVSLRALYNRNLSNVPAFDISRFIAGMLFDVRL